MGRKIGFVVAVSCFLIICVVSIRPVFAQWSNWFNVSDQQYKVYVENSEEKFDVTQGYYLTNFPCYGQYNREYYKTVAGRNMITLYCLQPPKEIYLSYITTKVGMFVSRNAKAEGYYKCEVEIVGNVNGGVIPRMQVDLAKCEKHKINPNANAEIVEEYDGIEL